MPYAPRKHQLIAVAHIGFSVVVFLTVLETPLTAVLTSYASAPQSTWGASYQYRERNLLRNGGYAINGARFFKFILPDGHAIN